MKQQFSSKLFIVLGISVFLLSCNPKAKQDESAGTSDTTVTEAPAQVQSMDAAKVAPDFYKVAKDTMGIRVLEITYKPGDSSAMHSHPDYVLYVIDGGKAQMTAKDGSMMVNELKSGLIMIGGAGTHSVKNVGTTTTRAILFEINRPNTAAPAQDAALNATKVAPLLYKTVADSLNIRVVMATYKPGASSKMHAHPDNAIYAVGGGKAVMTLKDGTKLDNTLATGAIMISPAGAHAVKNEGKTTVKVLIVEVNRPVQ
jgi:quercetin dioxygenase-like cupin family protein